MKFDMYRNIVLKKGSTNKERILYEKKRSFEEYLNRSPNAYEIIINDKPIKAIVQDVKFNDDSTDDKYLLCGLEHDINVGDYIVWQDMYWLIKAKEVETIQAYQSFKMGKCNQILNIQVGAEEEIIDYDPLGRPITKKTPIIYTTPCIASTKLYINSYTNKDAQINLPYGQIIVQFPYNPDYQVEPDMEFDMYGSHYKIFDIDKTSVINEKGVVEIIAEKVADSS